jgi:hypothetical protein
VKCSNHFGAKRRGLLKVNIVLAPRGAIQNFIKNIRYDISLHQSKICTISFSCHAVLYHQSRVELRLNLS